MIARLCLSEMEPAQLVSLQLGKVAVLAWTGPVLCVCVPVCVFALLCSCHECLLMRALVWHMSAADTTAEFDGSSAP